MIVHILLVYLANLFHQHQNQARRIAITEVAEYEVALMKNTKMNQEKSKLKRYLQLPVITQVTSGKNQVTFGDHFSYSGYKFGLKIYSFLKIDDPIERERVLEKREKNRVAAEKARQKKRERIDELEREKKRLEEMIAASDLDAVRIQRNLDYLRVSFQEHEKVCCFKK